MKVSEIRSMDIASLKERVAERKAELAKEKALVAGGTRPENPGKIKSVRRDIARLLTILGEKEKSPGKNKEKAVAKEKKPEKGSKEKNENKEKGEKKR